MKYEFVKPDPCPDSPDEALFAAMRDGMLARHGQAYFDENIHASVLDWLTDGFTVPNGGIYWSIVFSDVSDEQYRTLYEMPSLQRWHAKTYFGAPFDSFVNNPQSFDYLKVHLFRTAIDVLNFGRRWGDHDQAAYDFCSTLQIIDVGVTESRNYTSLAYACEKLIRQQLGDGTDFQSLADPQLLDAYRHEYVDRLVSLGNQVQRYSYRTRNAPCLWDVERAHSEPLTASDLIMIAKSAPAILFTQSLKGGFDTCRRPAVGCPV